MRIRSTWGLLVACGQKEPRLTPKNHEGTTAGRTYYQESPRGPLGTFYLGDCQHSFDKLCVVSYRQDPEIAAKESERVRNEVTGVLV